MHRPGLLCLLIVCSCAQQQPEVVRPFNNKTIVGRTYRVPVSNSGQTSVTRYSGLRYGVADRFAEAVPPPKSNDSLLNGTIPGTICVQATSGGEMTETSEDCLFLSVIVPGNGSIQFDNQLLPVVVLLHGDGFTQNNPEDPQLNGDQLAIRQDVVVVAVNYRLGIFGFWSDSGNVPWNIGLRDQVLALRWVKDNIEQLGGDSGRVTVVGFSSGGMSVSALVVSPYSRGLFSGAASLSGVLWNEQPTPEVQEQLSDVLRELARCGHNQTTVDCLRELTAEDLANLTSEKRLSGLFTAVVDGDFLPKNVGEMYESGDFARVAYVVGNWQQDGRDASFFVFGENHGQRDLQKEMIRDLIDDEKKYFPKSNNVKVNEAVMSYYFRNPNSPTSNANGYADLVGDVRFRMKTARIADVVSSFGAPTFVYSVEMNIVDRRAHNAAWVGTTCAPEVDYNCTQVERLLSDNCVEYIGGFIRRGSPMLNGATIGPYTPEVPSLSIFGVDGKGRLENGSVATPSLFFWNQLLPPYAFSEKISCLEAETEGLAIKLKNVDRIVKILIAAIVFLSFFVCFAACYNVNLNRQIDNKS